MFNPLVQDTTTSRVVAEVFGKEHSHVLRDIKNLECSKGFTESNFGLSEYLDSTGRKLPMYTLTKDGFTILAMGYTGAKDAQLKEKCIAEFNRMEAGLKNSALSSPEAKSISMSYGIFKILNALKSLETSILAVETT
jgi:Rha family phage regulatory protein